MSALIPGIYFSVCLALMVISLLETVIITNVLHHNSLKYREVPNWVRVVVLKHIANLICYRWPEDVQPPSTPQKDKPGSDNANSGPWIIQPATQAPDQHPPSNGNQTYSVHSHYCALISWHRTNLKAQEKHFTLIKTC